MERQKESTLKLASVQSSERSFKKIEWEFHEIRHFVVDNGFLATLNVDQESQIYKCLQ